MYTLSQFPNTSQRVMLSIKEIAHILILAEHYNNSPNEKTIEISAINGALFNKMSEVLQKTNTASLLMSISTAGFGIPGENSQINNNPNNSTNSFIPPVIPSQPFDTELTINASDDIKHKALQAVAATFNTDPKPDRSKDPVAGIWNSQMCSYYQAQVLSIQATGEIITGSISDSVFNKPISPIDKTLNIGITASEL